MDDETRMIHGGDLASARARHGEPGGGWLDLSTGIAPQPYPFTAPPPEAWAKLPQSDRLATLLDTARAAYGAPRDAPIVAAPGTQSLIQLLPRLRPAARVAIVGPTYSEHAKCWAQAGHRVSMVSRLDAADAKIVVLVNPNNPDGRTHEPSDISALAAKLAAADGMLIVDEAFCDLTPGLSAAPMAGMRGLVVLRSFGKFFGLAGARLGFALGHEDDIGALSSWLGPWAVPGPAIEIGIEALVDTGWAGRARETYAASATRLDRVLSDSGLEVIGGTALYRLVTHPAAAGIHTALGRAGIHVRAFADHSGWLRFGLPGTGADFARLTRALEGWRGDARTAGGR